MEKTIGNSPSQELINFLSQKISPILLKELFLYNQYTGEFLYNIDYGKIKKGTKAGSLNSEGYLKIEIAGKIYNASILAFVYINNMYPKKGYVIDHINGKRNDNRIENLREITVRGNAQNRSLKVNKLPLYVYNKRNKFVVNICSDKMKNYGTYNTINEAVIRRNEVCKQLNITIYE